MVINPQDAPVLLEKAKQKLVKEQAIIKGIKEGAARDKTWIEKALQTAGCEIIDDYYK